MTEIKGIYAATVSILDKNLSLNVDKTIKHAENLIDQGCHGVAIFGSTGQAQLISIGEKIQLINRLSESKYKDKFLIGTGLNSLGDTINFMSVANSLGFNKFLIMPPAYYKYGDLEVINFYSKIIEKINECKIILYNFEKLCGYKFTYNCVEELVKKFPEQIVGLKDSSYNLYETLKINNFSIFPGSETKLLKGLELGCSGIISATCNITGPLARNVYDNYFNGKKQVSNEKLCGIREAFDKHNLISAIHTFFAEKNTEYKNLLPTLKLLSSENKNNLMNELQKLDFKLENIKVT